jgi:hypothetical protein
MIRAQRCPASSWDACRAVLQNGMLPTLKIGPFVHFLRIFIILDVTGQWRGPHPVVPACARHARETK